MTAALSLLPQLHQKAPAATGRMTSVLYRQGLLFFISLAEDSLQCLQSLLQIQRL